MEIRSPSGFGISRFHLADPGADFEFLPDQKNGRSRNAPLDRDLAEPYEHPYVRGEKSAGLQGAGVRGRRDRGRLSPKRPLRRSDRHR